MSCTKRHALTPGRGTGGSAWLEYGVAAIWGHLGKKARVEVVVGYVRMESKCLGWTESHKFC